MRQIKFSALSLFLFFLTAQLFADGVDQTLLARLKTEGCAAIRAQEKFLSQVHLVILWTTVQRDGEFKHEYDCYADGGRFLLIRELPRDMRETPPTHNECRFVNNGKYYFEVSKKKSEELWEMDECLDLKSFDPNETEVAEVFDAFPCNIFGSSLADVIEKPGFDITRIEYVPDQPEETVEFDFEINADGVVAGLEEMRTGTIRLLPERGWTPKEMRLNSNRGGKPFVTTRAFTYGENSGQPFQLRHAQAKLYFDPDDESRFVPWDYEILEIDHAKVPKKELYLKYYGLDEPKFADPHTGLRGLFLAAGILIILFAVWRIRRRKRSEADRREL